jgi:hypothetical protein
MGVGTATSKLLLNRDPRDPESNAQAAGQVQPQPESALARAQPGTAGAPPPVSAGYSRQDELLPVRSDGRAPTAPPFQLQYARAGTNGEPSEQYRAEDAGAQITLTRTASRQGGDPPDHLTPDRWGEILQQEQGLTPAEKATKIGFDPTQAAASGTLEGFERSAGRGWAELDRSASGIDQTTGERMRAWQDDFNRNYLAENTSARGRIFGPPGGDGTWREETGKENPTVEDVQRAAARRGANQTNIEMGNYLLGKLADEKDPRMFAAVVQSPNAIQAMTQAVAGNPQAQDNLVRLASRNPMIKGFLDQHPEILGPNPPARPARPPVRPSSPSMLA